MRLAILCILCVLAAPPATAADDQIIAVIDLKFIRDTGEAAALMCFGDEDSDCTVWATHHLWEARVREVLAGVETKRKFNVLYGLHALSTRSKRRVTAVLQKLRPDDPTGARYQILAIGRRQELLCFDRAVAVAGAKILSAQSEHPMSCLDTNDE